MGTRDELAVKNIERYLKATKISQAALARQAKIDAVTLNRILKGTRGIGPDVAKKLADGMGISISDLYSDDGNAVVSVPRKDTLIAAVVALLPALNELELKALLSQAQESPSIALKSRGNSK